jgi:sugar fermentation stimulation protein A
LKFFENTARARFLERPNRFVVYCELDGRRVKAYLPNPGRLAELFLPGVTLHLIRSDAKERRTAYTAVAVERDGVPVMLHTHRTNDVAEYLLERGKVPGLEDTEILKREVTHGRSRFDFLLGRGRQRIYLEVKSCTLFSRRMAMFPDAVTARGKRHVEELAALSGRGERGAVLIIVHSAKARCFLPDYHTDLAFARSFLAARGRIDVVPLAVRWRRDLTLDGRVKLLDVPWPILEREAEDRGSYLIVLRKKRAGTCRIGKLGRIRFEKGYYIYVGSGLANLAKRIERHRRLEKKKHWHIDYLRATCEWVGALPILTADDLECAIAKRFRKLAEEEIPGFGSSDCACPSHLFRMGENPFDDTRFHDLLQHFRMDRLVGKQEVSGTR